MKQLLFSAVALALPATSFAHDTGAPHHHPHTDWTALIALAVLVVMGGLTLVALRAAKAKRKGGDHDPR
ncbi:MAG: hypothetical protein JJ908_13205 [Rhizobiales bacterium]|nr:hypothetical protein [Hyphomicrobiales bacterium]MBO6699783.1 hypothetical protein [Hyphomicrobiales bacterium]MBO6737321.1 hypothetical protein [Hyphomicrobiales bacterium]MBO6911605.1 hypothetical protein [Hyphomicrobiales bacterium]MBO6954973.1 hypothetical protein [Hyphomicrobiales bacterium]